MQTTIDKFGRIVIPKKLRDELGLEPGESLELEGDETGFHVKTVDEHSCLVKKGNVLVYTGETTGDLTRIVQDERDKRIRTLIDRCTG